MDNLLRHNLRNDLTTILGNARLIEDEVPETAAEVAVIRRTGQELLATAEKQRDLIEVLSREATPSTLDAVEVVATSVGTVSERFPAATIETGCPATAPVCALVELELGIDELLENAVRHSQSDDPTVRIEVSQRGETVLVAVEDEGPQIPDMEARVLTGDYEMNDLYHSTGLGLWLVYWVVELSDGQISVSATESGNRIEVALPSKDA